MLGSPESLRDTRATVYEQYQKTELTAEAAIERLRALDPDSPLAAVIHANALFTAGDLDGAESELWKAVSGAPCVTGAWFRLAQIHDQRVGDGRPFRLIALWQVATSDEVPEEIAATFAELGEIARSPRGFAALADRTEESLGSTPWPATLLPYRLLRAVQRNAETGLEPELLREILDHFETCAPVFRAALRQWSDDDGASLSDQAAALLIAILGERGAPALIDDLAPDEQYPTSEVLWHAQWAVWRIGQRHPAAAFERYQALTASADLTFRGFLAEQFYFLPPEIPGRKEAILRLLDGFPGEGEPEDAAYLLLTISTLMDMLGSPYDARAVLEKHQRRLSDEGRRWLADTLDSGYEFLPNLNEQAIDELTIEYVCSKLALMDGPDEDDEYSDEEEEYDDGGPAVAEPRPGRNDPCRCGSGKKYKKCHLVEDEEADRAASTTRVAELRRVIADIMQLSVHKMSRADFTAAHRLFFAREPGLVEPDDDAQAAFIQWLILDHRPESGRTGVDEYVRRRGRIPEKDRPLIDAFRNARYALWEVQRVERGRGIEVKDYFGGEPFFVHDVSSSRNSAQWDCLVAYFFDWDGRWEFFADGFTVPRSLLPRIVEMVESGAREAKLSASEFFRRRSHEWRRLAEQAGRDVRFVTAEGDALEPGAAVYEVADAAAAEAALLTGAQFASERPGTVVWVDDSAAGSGRVFGHVRIEDGRLRLEANSRRRLGVGRQLVEKHAGTFLRHLEDVFDPVPAGPPAPTPVPPDVERELILKVKAAHYATWPDEPLPALGGRTPRLAARSETGRRAVEEVLRFMEDGEDRERLAGRAAFDFTPLRKQLGL